MAACPSVLSRLRAGNSRLGERVRQFTGRGCLPIHLLVSTPAVPSPVLTPFAERCLPFVARCFDAGSWFGVAASLAVVTVAGAALGLHETPAWLIVPLLAGAPAYFSYRAAIRTWRMRLTVTAKEVVVADVFCTHHVPLEDVVRFEAQVVHAVAAGNGTPMIVLLRRDADPIAVYATSRLGSVVWRFKTALASLESDASELNRAVARARNPTP